MSTDASPAAAGLTRDLAAAAADLKAADLSADALTMARHCLLDWFAVTIAGANEPLVDVLLDEVTSEGGAAQALISARGVRPRSVRRRWSMARPLTPSITMTSIAP